jgi:hypothetical protein
MIGKDELKEIVEAFRDEISTTEEQISGVTINKKPYRIIIKNNRKYLNLFSGYSIEYDEKAKVYKDDIQNNHIYRLINGLLKHNPVYVDYLCKFFAYNLFNDDENRKAGKIIIFHSRREGVGKGSLMKFFETVLNDHYVNVLQDELDGQFNSYLEKALVCFFDEVELDKDTYDKKIKPLVTSEKIRINEKGVKQYTKLNNCMYVVATNSRNSARITRQDRRSIMFDCGSEYEKDFPFWREYNENLLENSKQFFLYLKTLYEENDKNDLYFFLERGIVTEYKQEVINMNLDSVEAFLDDIINDYEYKDKLYELLEVKDENSYVVASDLYRLYKTYCEENSKKPQGRNKFLITFNNDFYSLFKTECYSGKNIIWINDTAKNVMDFSALFDYLKNRVDQSNIQEKEWQCIDAYNNGKEKQGNKILYYIKQFYDNISNGSSTEEIKRLNILTERIKEIKRKDKKIE